MSEKMKKKFILTFITIFILISGVVGILRVNAANVNMKYEDSINAPTVRISETPAAITIRYVSSIFCWTSIILFISGIIIMVKNKARKHNLFNDEYINKKEKNKEDEEAIKKSKKAIICIVVAIILFSLMCFLRMTITLAAKPIIYLYPEEEKKISVTLGNPERLTCSYPKYEESWEVFAKPNGDLTDLKTGRNLYALYWEGKNKNNIKINEGFCVKGEDSANFLEETLAILGLNEREAEEFIVYWLPTLEKSKYNLIRFETKEEINNNMPLEINPQPDTLIRVMMEYKPSNKYVNLPEQKLETPERKGFVAVEWGGTEIK